MPVESALRDGDGAGFELIETLRWERGQGFIRLERHLARLYASASKLGFACDPAKIGGMLAQAVSASDRQTPASSFLRVRLTLAQNGSVQCSAQPFALLPPQIVWTLRTARTHLTSTDALLRHKTSRRAVYDAARAEFTHPQADEVILLNERGEVCEGAITSLFADFGDGQLKTPALQCGLLAGVLRGEMIDDGAAVEGVLMPDDLQKAKALWVGNSLRGLIRAEL